MLDTQAHAGERCKEKWLIAYALYKYQGETLRGKRGFRQQFWSDFFDILSSESWFINESPISPKLNCSIDMKVRWRTNILKN